MMLRATADLWRGRRNRRNTKPHDPILPRVLARMGAVIFLAGTLFYGLLIGGHSEHPLSPVRTLVHDVAGYFGYLAEDVRISALKHNTAEQVLAAISVTPGRPLIGFDANQARRILNNLDWVKRAQVRRVHPNRLDIDVIEREPFVIWQTNSNHYVLDREGRAISSLEPARYPQLLVVSGNGAKEAVYRFVNHIEAYPALKSKLKGAARVGGRRWTLYLMNDLKVLLPEQNIHQALKVLAGLQLRENVFERPIRQIDLRSPDRIVIAPKSASETALLSRQ